MATPLTIGRIARQAGVNVETVRYYQRVGLIEEPRKPGTGYRVYPASSVDRIRFIKRAQQLGFSLKEIIELLEIGDGHCNDVREKAEAKRSQIETQIRDLQLLYETLTGLIEQCQATGESGHCPVVEALAGNADSGRAGS